MIGQGTGAAHNGGRGHTGGLNDLEVERQAVRQAVIGGRVEVGKPLADFLRGLLSICILALLFTALRAIQLAVRITV